MALEGFRQLTANAIIDDKWRIDSNVAGKVMKGSQYFVKCSKQRFFQKPNNQLTQQDHAHVRLLRGQVIGTTTSRVQPRLTVKRRFESVRTS